MSPPISPTQHSIKKLVNLVIQMTFGVLLFCLFLALSVESKPVGDGEVACGYDACPSFDPDVFYVHIIPHSHDDVGWLKTLDQYYFQDVQNVISSVIVALKQNPDRRFVQVETAYFKKWWLQQTQAVKETVVGLINNGQLEIIGGGWSMNDEGAVHYQSTIDQFTLGLRFLEDNLGKCSRPRVGWQIDPFGHSREQASISAQMGFDSMFFARLDYRDKAKRLSEKSMDLLWRGSANLGNTSDIFTSVLYNHYSAPYGFCFDHVCNDEPIIDDAQSPDYNYQKRVEDFASFVKGQFQHYPTNNILVTMGDDFRYEAALTTYINLDRLIKGFDLFEQTLDDKRIKVIYSTPSCYAKAVNEYIWANDVHLELKTDDFFPYADSPNTYWTGYFTSRPASKRFERTGNNLLQVAKQLAAQADESYYNEQINSLKEAMGVLQHHDAITGTEKQHVAHNYHLLLSDGVKNANDAAGAILANLISGRSINFEFDSCLLANVSACAPTESSQFIVVVYNPLSRPQSSAINIPIFTDQTQWHVIDPDGDSVEYELDSSLGNFSYVTDARTASTTLVFIAKDIPALGYKVYRIEASVAGFEHAPAQGASRFVGYEDVGFEISGETGLLTSVTMNGLTRDVGQDFGYYTSENTSGAYIFVPTSNETVRIAQGPITTTLVAGDVSQGVLQEFGTWARQFIKVYKDDPAYIEFDWVIGPIDISDNLGKEVVTKFTTSLRNNGVFYTDSNGREMVKRTRNSRPSYSYTDEQPISGNYYPINSKIVIKDEDQGIELAILTDRSQGGTSIQDGGIEIMVHRACQHDDSRGVGESLNEQEYGQGIEVRGKHYLVLGPSSGPGDTKSMAAVQRDIAQRKILAPWTFITAKDLTSNLANLEFSGINRNLPENVQILTLEPWKDNVLLLRLEHVFEKGEDERFSKDAEVDLEDLFTQFTIEELQETILSGNVLLEENTRLSWPGSTNNAELPHLINGLKVALAPMQIRTFLATVSYN